MSKSNGTSGKTRGVPAKSMNPGKLVPNAPANARTVKSSAKTGTITRSAARSAAKAVSNGR